MRVQKEADDMGSLDTMTLLADSFIELAEQMPFEKISVSDIVAASNKNRKTFYYHFEDKDQMVHWIFRRDIAAELERVAERDELVTERVADRSPNRMAYYLRRKIGVRSLDGSVFFQALSSCLMNRRSFYSKALRQTGSASLSSYLRALYTPALEEDIRFILSNRYLSEGNIRFLAEFYVGAFVTFFAQKVCDPSCTDIMASVRPFDNIIHSSLESEIKKQQLKRIL